MGSQLFQDGLDHKVPVRVGQSLAIKNWLDVAVRIGLSIGLSFFIYLVVAQAVADRYSRQETLEGYRKAIQWEPWNPEYYADLARALQRPLKNGDLTEVILLYEKAIQLSPHDAAYWARLGQAYEWSGRNEDAQRAYERARILFPNSPAINWTVGNFYLREGRGEQALLAFQKAMLGDPDLRRPAFDLAWRATENGELIAQAMVPARADICFEYLDYLLGTQRMAEATQVWNRVHELGLRFEAKAAFPYLDALIQQRRIDQLTSAWAQLTERNRSRLRKGALEANLVTNGGFESEILNGGLDWRVNPTQGAVVSVDSLTFLDGAHSLRVRFDGKYNLDYSHVLQYVPVKPNTSYRFAGYMRTQGITTDSGPRFQIYDPYDPARLFLESDNLVATSTWLPQQLHFKSGFDTRLLVIRVARPASHKFDNRIAGTVWVGRVVLSAVE
jgi:tetratricopeptide (TPR) repeat protein